jgi:hypothetical protein
MLYLNPPYFVINGVSIFPDHQDPLQFYCLPMMPHLTTATDSASGIAMPRIQLIEYEGSAGTGGFINFDVNLGIDPSVLSDVANQLQRQAQLSDQPRLSPVTFVDGTVKLVILGAESPDPAPSTGSTAKPASAPAPSSGADGGPKFVVKIQNAAKPALYGDNQATFSVQLDQYGATVLEQAIKGQMAPIAVIYSLDFLALRPAFNVHLSADWSRVQKYLDDHYSGGFLFFSSDIEKTVNSLIENQVISIQVDTFVPDGDTSASGSSDRDRAVSECYELIKNNFFESSLRPPNPNQPDGWDKAAAAAGKINDMALTGGAAGMASFSYKQADLTRIDNKCLDVNIRERSCVRRTIYPQAHLSGLLGVIQRSGVSLDQFIVKVDLDNPWFQRRHVNVVSHADFESDSIASIDVNLTYNNIVKSVTLSSTGAQSAVEWSSVVVSGQMQRTVTYTYTVNFKNIDTTQRPGQLTSAPKSVVGDVVDIEPRNDLYGITVVPIRAYGFPWDRYPSAEVECRYADQANCINLQASAVLTSQTPEVDWPLFLRDQTHRSFDYRLTYTLASGGTSVTPWVATDAAKIDVVDPFPSKMTLVVVPALDWTVVDQALVFVAYPSRDNPVAQKEYAMTKSNPASQSFVAERQDASQNLIYYEARLIKHNGRLWTVPGSVTSSKYLILQDGMKGHQIVSVRPEQIDFASKRVSKIDVQLRYVDTQNSLDAASRFTLSTVTDVQSFSYDYINDQISPEYRADIQLDNGQTKSSDWAPISGNSLTIQLSQLD